ncbi:MAG: ATP-dependent Clp protease ATP-binding subunit, partial [Bacteroidales bacterium]|nr:ATP-dependent Clp protease ATP-binding subunit [Bacteroidales bacterium]
IQKALNKTFAPEFLNRIDDVIHFDPLQKESILQIIDLEMDAFNQRVENLGFLLDISAETKSFLADKGYDIQFGARPLKRAIQQYLEDELAELILGGSLKPGDRISITMDETNTHVLKTVNGQPV